MSRATVEDLGTAILWLECNNGDGGEAESCRRAASFLKSELDRRQIAAIARSHNLPRSMARKVFQKITDKENAT